MKRWRGFALIRRIWLVGGAFLLAPMAGHAHSAAAPVHPVLVRSGVPRTMSLPSHYRKVTLHHQTYYYFRHHYYAVSGRTLERIPAARLLSLY